MRNYFVFNGVDSREYGLYISGTGRLTVPEKAYEFAEIPGQNGEHILNRNARVRNEGITYPAFISPFNESGVRLPFGVMASRMRSWLLSVKGYAELYDSYDPDHYRRAAFTGPTEFELTPTLEAGSFELSFNCKPQRYLRESETIAVGFEQTKTIHKCPFYYSVPLIAINDEGSIAIDDQTITVATNDLQYPIYIDSLLMNCYDSRGINANLYVSFSNYTYPTIADGSVLSGTETSFSVEPRWYEL